MSKNKLEKNILRSLYSFGIMSFVYLLKKPPVKDWLIIFFFKAYVSSILDTLVVRKGYIVYPFQLAKSFDVSFLFDYILFPVSCVYYNLITKKGKLINIIFKVFLFSGPMTIAESWLEKNTKLIKYRKGWNPLFTFSSLTLTFWFVRLIISLIRYLNLKEKDY